MPTIGFSGTNRSSVSSAFQEVDTTKPIIVTYSHRITGTSSCCPLSCSSNLDVKDADGFVLQTISFGACENIVPTDIQPFVQGLSAFSITVRGPRCSCTPSRTNRVTVMNVIGGTVTFENHPLKAVVVQNDLVNNILLDLAGRHSTINGIIVVSGASIPVDINVKLIAGGMEILDQNAIDSLQIDLSGIELDQFLGIVDGLITMTVPGLPPVERTFTISNQNTIEQFPFFMLEAIQLFKFVDVDGFAKSEMVTKITSNNVGNPIPFRATLKLQVADRSDPSIPVAAMSVDFDVNADEVKSEILRSSVIELNPISDPDANVQVFIQDVMFFEKQQVPTVINEPPPPDLIECVDPCTGARSTVPREQGCPVFADIVCPEPEPIPEPVPEPVPMPQNNTRRNVAIAGVALVAVAAFAIRR